jgi:hypothetical protein
VTFEDVWRYVLGHCPLAGSLLAREWVQGAYNEFATARSWSDLRAESVITINDQKTGDCTVAKGSATVNGGTLTFAATDVGRQFRLGSIPLYTIIAVSVAGGTSCTLDRVYGEASGLVIGYILDAYITVPTDFNRFYAILDPSNKWRLRWWLSADILNRLDPGRMSTGNACMLFNQKYSPVAANAGQARFEFYPFQTSARSYPMWYMRKGAVLADDDVFIGQLANRAKDVLGEYALSRAAMWPGVEGKKNPYFNLSLAQAHEKEFERKISDLRSADDDLYFEDVSVAEYPYAPFPWDSAWLQNHEPYYIG